MDYTYSTGVCEWSQKDLVFLTLLLVSILQLIYINFPIFHNLYYRRYFPLVSVCSSNPISIVETPHNELSNRHGCWQLHNLIDAVGGSPRQFFCHWTNWASCPFPNGFVTVIQLATNWSRMTSHSANKLAQASTHGNRNVHLYDRQSLSRFGDIWMTENSFANTMLPMYSTYLNVCLL